jgi:cell division protein FtsI (penicillin-binding protein 3)
MKKILLFISIAFAFLSSCNNNETVISDGFVFKSGELFDKNGKKVESTIDNNLQKLVDSLLRSHLNIHKANSACAVIMDTKTGAIKAMVNLCQRQDGSFSLDSNLVVNLYTEFGSNFKLYSAMALIEDGFAKVEDSVFVDNGSCVIGGHTITDEHKYPEFKMTFMDGFVNSSNVVFSRLVYDAYRSKPERFLSHLSEANFNSALPTDLVNFNSPTYEKLGTPAWDSAALQYLSIGYGIKLSPLHILTYYNSIANNGEMLFPYFAKMNQGKFAKKKVCKPETAAVLRSLLGSAYKRDLFMNSNNEQISIAGKSATINQSLMGEGFLSFTSSYVGYFPAASPKYTCLVVFNNPQNGEYYGSTVSGPVFKEIAKFLK